MKRFLSLFLVLVLILSTLASCNLFGKDDVENTVTTPVVSEPDIQEAVKLLDDMYKNIKGTSIPDGYTLVAQIPVGRTMFAVEWTSDNADVTFTLVDGLYNINLPTVDEDVEYTITANITSPAGQKATTSINLVLSAAASFGMITEPEVGVAYKLALLHRNEGGVVYFDGNNYNGYDWYFSYTTDVSVAVDVYLEAVEDIEGGLRLYFDKDGVKTYIVAFPRDGDTTKGTLKFDTAVPDTYWTYSTEYNTLVYTSVTGEQFYMGSSGTYKSISCSAISYVTNDTSYPCRLYGAGGVEEVLPEQQLPTMPENYTSKDVVETLYKLQPGQTLEGPYEFTGVITSIKYEYDPGYNNISVNIVVDGMTDKPVLCYRLNGGQELEVGDTITVFAGLTNYNGTYETTSGGVIREVVKGNGTVPTPPTPDTDTPESILNALYALADGESLTGSFTLTGEITALDKYNNPTIVVEGFEDKPVYCYKLVVDKAVGDVITVTATTMKNYGGTYEFMNCTLVEDGGNSGDDPVVTPTYTAPVAGQPYYFFIEQTTLGKKLYFAGTMDGNYLATTEDSAAAVAIYFEEVTGGYHIYFMDGETKTYITAAAYLKSSGYAGCHFSLTTETPTLAWTYNTTYGIIEIYDEIEGKSDTFFAGTYSNYTTFSLSGQYYRDQITSGAQFPGRIELIEGDDTHEHVFVDGKCSCGEIDPSHEHSYTNGKCACGETDPNHEHSYVDGKCECGEVEDDGIWTIPEVLASASGTSVVISGTVSEIYQSWNDQYSNISFYISDEAGNKLLVYRTGTKVVVGDQVTVTGTTTLYNSVIQIAQGGVTVVDVAHVCSEYTEGSCTIDSVCVVCGAVGTKAAGHNYVDGTCSACGEAEPQGDVLPGNLVFTGLANKASADTYLKTNYPEWTITGKLGNGYADYLGFGRSGDSSSAITSPMISVSNAFTVTAVLKGNGSSGVATSTLTFTLIDKDGNVVATGYANGSTTAAITPVDAVDTTYTISFTFVEGKTWTDVSNLVITFAKATGNIGMKSLDFVQ